MSFSAIMTSSSRSIRIAVWGGDRRIVAMTCVLLAVDLVSACFVAQGHAQYSPLIQTCDWPVMMAFITDISSSRTHLWNMLYFQGLFWIVASFVVGMPDTILPFLNINGENHWIYFENVMFLYPQSMPRVIASSRAYRELYQYPSRSRLRKSNHLGPPPPGWVQYHDDPGIDRMYRFR
ncbi:hypothetical protein BGW80DRAFT_1325043 [Lactifluus volemus]|nr:hypothetical protein BGW80DRAFT_1325043 [Lactifluus volemus]